MIMIVLVLACNGLTSCKIILMPCFKPRFYTIRLELHDSLDMHIKCLVKCFNESPSICWVNLMYLVYYNCNTLDLA